MIVRRSLYMSLALAGLFSSCVSADLDEADRHAFFIDARVRKELKGEADHQGAHAELGWKSVEGDADDLEYSIGTAMLGIGVDWPMGDKVWGGAVGGLAWQRTHFNEPSSDFDSEDDYGPYVAIQAGWIVTPWLEPFARANVGLYFPSTTLGLEVGVRLHGIKHTALFAGWRYTRFEIADLDNLTSINTVELDTSGLVVGLELAF